MADNLTISTGTGTTIATDQVGTAHYQKVKLVVGAADTANLVVFGQTAMTASLPVVIATDQSTLSVAVVATLPTGTATIGCMVPVPHYNRIAGSLEVATSTAQTIVVTSGAHTIYITDLIISADTVNGFKFFSATTAITPVFRVLANTTFVLGFQQALKLNSNQSLVVALSTVLGTGYVYVGGYTIT